jgi:hypothetical protein
MTNLEGLRLHTVGMLCDLYNEAYINEHKEAAYLTVLRKIDDIEDEGGNNDN